VAASGAKTAGLKIIDAKGHDRDAGYIDAHRHINTGPSETAADAALLGPLHHDSGPAAGRGRQHHAGADAHREGWLINGPRVIPTRVGAREHTRQTPGEHPQLGRDFGREVHGADRR